MSKKFPNSDWLGLRADPEQAHQAAYEAGKNAVWQLPDSYKALPAEDQNDWIKNRGLRFRNACGYGYDDSEFDTPFEQGIAAAKAEQDLLLGSKPN